MEQSFTKLTKLMHALQVSWSQDTSSDGAAWSAKNPTAGQCKVTAIILQDYIGGDILHTTATLPSGETDSHYYNSLDGNELDLTKQQFPKGTTFAAPDQNTAEHKTLREALLADPDTASRYELLKEKVALMMKDSDYYL